MYKEKEDAKEREDNEKRIKREEREKKRKLNEELKMKRMQERSDKQKKDEEKQQKAQAKIHKGDCTVHETYKRKKASGATGPGKSGLECSRCHDKVHVSCVGKAYLQYVEGYDDDDDDDFEFFVLAAFGLMTTAQSTRMPVSLIK